LFQQQQQAALMAAAASQGTYIASPVTTLAHMSQVGALAPNGISTAALTPTTASLVNGMLIFNYEP